MVAPLIGLAGRFAAQYGAPLVGAAARQFAARQAASAAASGAGRSLLGSIPGALARGAAVGGAAQVASNLVGPTGRAGTEPEVESDNTAALASSEDITTPQAQTTTTEIASISPSKDGDISGKLSDSPIISLLRSIDNSMKELKDALLGTRAPAEAGGGTSGISGLMGPRAAGISGSLLLALAPAIADFFDRVSERFNQGAANRESANQQAAENRANMSPRQAAGAANPGQQQAENIRRGYNVSNEQIATIQDTLDAPETNETPALEAERLRLRQAFDAASRQGNQNVEVTPELQQYLEERRAREAQPFNETGSEVTPSAPADPDAVRRFQERTQAVSRATERAAAAPIETQARLAERSATEQQALQRGPTPEQAATYDEEERRQAERAAARGPGIAARTISAITGLFSPRAFTQPASQRTVDIEAARSASTAEAETLFPRGSIEPVTPGEQNVRALSTPAAQPQPVIINAQNPGAAPMPVSVPGSGMQTQGGGLPPPGSTPPRVDAAHPEMVSQSPAMGRGYGP